MTINDLSRVEKGPLNARVWMDASGTIWILLEGGGAIEITMDKYGTVEIEEWE